MIGGMIVTVWGRNRWKGNKTHINPARNGKFLKIILLTKKERRFLKSNFVSFYKINNLC
jgi:hypothetical protein